MAKDYYRILEIAPEATHEEIKGAYRRLALEHHPDRNLGDPGSEEYIKEINEAYNVLGREETKRRYDFQRRQTGQVHPSMDGVSEEELNHMMRFATGIYQPPKRGMCRGRGRGGNGCGRGRLKRGRF